MGLRWKHHHPSPITQKQTGLQGAGNPGNPATRQLCEAGYGLVVQSEYAPLPEYEYTRQRYVPDVPL